MSLGFVIEYATILAHTNPSALPPLIELMESALVGVPEYYKIVSGDYVIGKCHIDSIPDVLCEEPDVTFVVITEEEYRSKFE